MFAYSTAGVGTPIWLLITIQIVMSLGLAASFTRCSRPLWDRWAPPVLAWFGALNTLQQVAGAPGTTLLISIYSAALHAGQAEGRVRPRAGAPGGHAAFLLATVIAIVPIILAFFIRKPEDQEECPPRWSNRPRPAPPNDGPARDSGGMIHTETLVPNPSERGFQRSVSSVIRGPSLVP